MLASVRLTVGLALLSLAAVSIPLICRAGGESDERPKPRTEGELVRDVTTYEQQVQDIRDVLNGPMAFDHRGERLSKTLSAIANAHKVNIAVKQGGMKKEPPSEERLAAIELRGRTVGEALTVLLDAYDLDYYVDDLCIQITSVEEVQKRLEIRAYDVKPLLIRGITVSDVARVLPVSLHAGENPRPIVLGDCVIVSLTRKDHARVLEFLRKSTPDSIRAGLIPLAPVKPVTPPRSKEVTARGGERSGTRET